MASLSHGQAAFAMTFGAGLSTGIGALLVCFTTSLNRSLLVGTMAFSSGVMIYVSLVEVIAVSHEHFRKGYSENLSYAFATLSFFAGAAIMALVDAIVHTIFNAVTTSSHGSSGVHQLGRSSPSEGRTSRDSMYALEHGLRERSAPNSELYTWESQSQGLCTPAGTADLVEGGLAAEEAHDHDHDHDDDAAAIAAVAAIGERRKLLSMAAVVSAAIVLHNIPEGMATYVASFHSVSAGLPLAVAIAIHNIPEGLAVAMPIYHATRSKSRAVCLGTLSGMSEPFGAFLASFVANDDSTTAAFGGMFGLTAGMMTYVCISELLPTAFEERGVRRGVTVASFFAGCAVMALSLVAERFAGAV